MEESPSDSQRSSDEPSELPSETPSDSQRSSDGRSRTSSTSTPSDSRARTPSGSSVGVDDPYEHVERCDHCTDDGKCRFAFERFEADPTFARERRDDDYRCPVARQTVDEDSGDWEEWADCPNFASTTDGSECRRCGLEERRVAHADERALIEEHHLSYADGGEQAGLAADDADRTSGADADGTDCGDGLAHEITVALCRWCHAKVHESWARVDDDVSPDPEAIAAREQRRGRELEEASFQSAAERYDGEE